VTHGAPVSLPYHPRSRKRTGPLSRIEEARGVAGSELPTDKGEAMVISHIEWKSSALRRVIKHLHHPLENTWAWLPWRAS
jgi:hypothetical protein